tara:strand:+ start:341 stop:511 length:171 start_codon:yes stop_codon:yes gene_type:complete
VTLVEVVDLVDLEGELEDLADLEGEEVADWERQDKRVHMHSYHYPHHLPIDLESLP